MSPESAGASESLVRSWSHDWREALPTRTAGEQTRLVDAARDAVVALQAVASAGDAAGRALHRRGIHQTTFASFTVDAAVPGPLRLGPFAPGAAWPATVRLSSAFALTRSDEVPDQRGLAVRITDGPCRLDLLGTTGEAHHARDAAAMIVSLQAAAKAARGGLAGRLAGLVCLVRGLGLRDGLRMARTVTAAAQAGLSLAALSYYSRAPFQLGPFAVRYRFHAIDGVDPSLRAGGVDGLALDLLARLQNGPVAWDFQLQGYLDPMRTSMSDQRVPWDSPWLTIGRLMLSPTPAPSTAGVAGQSPDSDSGTAIGFQSTPDWPDPRGAVLEPLGDLNALRAAAYAASQAGRTVDRQTSSAPRTTPRP